MTQKNIPHSVRQKLLKLSRETGEDFLLLFTRYAIERLLFRLAASIHRKYFVLKGAMLFALWTGEMHRPTRDLDLLGFGANDADRLREIFTTLCTVVLDDGLEFRSESITVEEIREDQEYTGKRVVIEVRLQSAKIPLQVDIGFGDAITPKADVVEYPTLLQMESPKLRAYPKETVVAEKFEALVKLGLANSRMKDFYDLLILARMFPFEGDKLSKAITATFQRRGTPLPNGTPLALTDTFAKDDSKLKQWRAFRSRNGLEEQVGSLSEVVEELGTYLLQPLHACVAGHEWKATWLPKGPWQPA